LVYVHIPCSNTSDCFGRGNYGSNAMAAINQQVSLAGLGIGVSDSNFRLGSLGALARAAKWHEPGCTSYDA